MKIRLTSIFVDDQSKALKFYTEVLGFVKDTDVPMGPDARWLTVTSPDGVEGVELLLEPMGLPAAVTYQKALFDAGIPCTSFGSNEIQKEYEKLKALGVNFRVEPTKMDYGGIDAMFEDTCGNLINLHQD